MWSVVYVSQGNACAPPSFNKDNLRGFSPSNTYTSLLVLRGGDLFRPVLTRSNLAPPCYFFEPPVGLHFSTKERPSPRNGTSFTVPSQERNVDAFSAPSEETSCCSRPVVLLVTTVLHVVPWATPLPSCSVHTPAAPYYTLCTSTPTLPYANIRRTHSRCIPKRQPLHLSLYVSVTVSVPLSWNLVDLRRKAPSELRRKRSRTNRGCLLLCTVKMLHSLSCD